MEPKNIIFVSLCFLLEQYLVESVDVNCIENVFTSKGPLQASIGTYQNGFIERIDLSSMKAGTELVNLFSYFHNFIKNCLWFGKRVESFS